MHLARARPLQGLRLVLDRGLQSCCLRSSATRLKSLLRVNKAASWLSPALPIARLSLGKSFSGCSFGHYRAKSRKQIHHSTENLLKSPDTPAKTGHLWTETSLVSVHKRVSFESASPTWH